MRPVPPQFRNSITTDEAPFTVPLWGQIAFPILAMLLGVYCFSIDLAVTSYCFEGRQHPFLREVAQNTEGFGHGIGVFFILISLHVCRPGHFLTYLRAAAICLVAGLTTDALKLSYGRIRPRSLDWDSITHVSQTFQGWFPLWNDMPVHKSFPSGHTTVAFALAVALSTIHPRGKWIFFTLAVLVGLGRIETGAHYPSDVCFGAAVGWTVAFVMTHLFNRRSRFDFQQSGSFSSADESENRFSSGPADSHTTEESAPQQLPFTALQTI